MLTFTHTSENIGLIRKKLNTVRDDLNEIVPDSTPHYKKFAILKQLKEIEDILMKEAEVDKI